MSHNAVTLNLGDTLKASCTYRDANGDPVNLDTAGIAISSIVRNPDGTSEHTLTVTLANQTTDPGEFTIRGDTADFATTTGTWTWLIRYTQAGDVFSTEQVKVTLR